jgi:aryl-phospho-beta-D-glucosidase BglC (GH1 family)
MPHQGNANIVDEWTFGSLQSRSTATAALTNHWNTWITEADFAAIAAAGLNHVRLPIGYWAWDVSGGQYEPCIQVSTLNKCIQASPISRVNLHTLPKPLLGRVTTGSS